MWQVGTVRSAGVVFLFTWFMVSQLALPAVAQSPTQQACEQLGFTVALINPTTNRPYCYGPNPNERCGEESGTSVPCGSCSQITGTNVCCTRTNVQTGTNEFRCAPIAAPITSVEVQDVAALPEPATVRFSPNISIPGSIFTAGKPVDVTGSTFAEYVGGFYKFFIAMIAVVAVVMTMWGGFKRIMAAGNAEKISSANGTIGSALVGLLITLLSYTLLNLLNPALVTLKSLAISSVPRIEFEFGGDEPGTVVGTPGCTPESRRGDDAASAILAYASTFAGRVTYHLGAKDPTVPCGSDGKHPAGQLCFDCSGFVNYVYACKTGISVPAYSSSLQTWGGNAEMVKLDNVADLLPGDIFGWGKAASGGNSGHVAIVSARGDDKITSFLNVWGSEQPNSAFGSQSMSYSALGEKCIAEGPGSNRCFYWHLKRASDYTIACGATGSAVPCGLRSPASSCTYREFEAIEIPGLGDYKVGKLSGGCRQQ